MKLHKQGRHVLPNEARAYATDSKTKRNIVSCLDVEEVSLKAESVTKTMCIKAIWLRREIFENQEDG